MPLSYNLSNNGNQTERSKVWKRLDDLEKAIVQQSEYLTAKDGHLVHIQIDNADIGKENVADSHIHNLVAENANIKNLNSDGFVYLSNLVVDSLTFGGTGTQGKPVTMENIQATSIKTEKLEVTEPVDKLVIGDLTAGKTTVDILKGRDITADNLEVLSTYIKRGGKIYTDNNANVLLVEQDRITIGNANDVVSITSKTRPQWSGKHLAVLDDVQQPFTFVDAVDKLSNLPPKAANGHTYLVSDLEDGHKTTGLAIWLDSNNKWNTFPYYPLSMYRTFTDQDIIDDQIRNQITLETQRASAKEQDLQDQIDAKADEVEKVLEQLEDETKRLDEKDIEHDTAIEQNRDAITGINDRLDKEFLKDVPTTDISLAYVRKYDKDTDRKYWEVQAQAKDALNKSYEGTAIEHKYVESDVNIETFTISKTPPEAEWAFDLNGCVLVDDGGTTFAVYDGIGNFKYKDGYDGPVKGRVDTFATDNKDDEVIITCTLAPDVNLDGCKARASFNKTVVALKTELSNDDKGFVIDSTKAATMTTPSERTTVANYENTKKDILTKEYLHDNITIVSEGGTGGGADLHDSTLTGKTLYDALNGQAGFSLNMVSTVNGILSLPQIYTYDTGYSQSSLFDLFGHLYNMKIKDGKYMSTIWTKDNSGMIAWLPIIYGDNGNIRIVPNQYLHAHGTAANTDSYRMPLTYAANSKGQYLVFNYVSGYWCLYNDNDTIITEGWMTIGAGNNVNGYNLITNTNRRPHVIAFDDWFYVAIPTVVSGAGSAQGLPSFVLAYNTNNRQWEKKTIAGIDAQSNQNDVQLPPAMHLIRGDNCVWFKIYQTLNFGKIDREGRLSIVTANPGDGQTPVGTQASFRRWRNDWKMLEDGRIMLVMDKSSAAADMCQFMFLDGKDNTAKYYNIPGSNNKYSGFTTDSIEETKNFIWVFPCRAQRYDAPPTTQIGITYEWNYGLTTAIFKINKQSNAVTTTSFPSMETNANTLHGNNTRRMWTRDGNKKYLWLMPSGIKTEYLPYIDYDDDSQVKTITLARQHTWQGKTDTCSFMHNGHYLCASNSDGLGLFITYPVSGTDKGHCVCIVKSPGQIKEQVYDNYGINSQSWDNNMLTSTLNHNNMGVFSMGPHFVVPRNVGGLAWNSDNQYAVLYMKSNVVPGNIRWS